MAKTKETQGTAAKIESLAGEPCDADELNKWSAGRWLAGQHQAAFDVQARYEALIRHQNPDRVIDFHRNEETGELSFTIAKTEEEELAELEKEENERLKREANEKAKREGEADEKGRRSKRSDDHG